MAERRAVYRRDHISEALAMSLTKRLDALEGICLSPVEHRIKLGIQWCDRTDPAEFERKSDAELAVSIARGVRIPCPFSKEIAILNGIAQSLNAEETVEWDPRFWDFQKVVHVYNDAIAAETYYDLYVIQDEFYSSFEALRQKCIHNCIEDLKAIRETQLNSAEPPITQRQTKNRSMETLEELDDDSTD